MFYIQYFFAKKETKNEKMSLPLVFFNLYLLLLPHSLKSNSATIKANIRYSNMNVTIGAIIHANTLFFLLFINQIV